MINKKKIWGVRTWLNIKRTLTKNWQRWGGPRLVVKGRDSFRMVSDQGITRVLTSRTNPQHYINQTLLLLHYIDIYTVTLRVFGAFTTLIGHFSPMLLPLQSKCSWASLPFLACIIDKSNHQGISSQSIFILNFKHFSYCRKNK